MTLIRPLPHSTLFLSRTASAIDGRRLVSASLTTGPDRKCRQLSYRARRGSAALALFPAAETSKDRRRQL